MAPHSTWLYRQSIGARAQTIPSITEQLQLRWLLLPVPGGRLRRTTDTRPTESPLTRYTGLLDNNDHYDHNYFIDPNGFSKDDCNDSFNPYGHFGLSN